METLQLISELRVSLQAQTTRVETTSNGMVRNLTESIITDQAQRQQLTTKLVELLLSLEPEVKQQTV